MSSPWRAGAGGGVGGSAAHIPARGPSRSGGSWVEGRQTAAAKKERCRGCYGAGETLTTGGGVTTRAAVDGGGECRADEGEGV